MVERSLGGAVGKAGSGVVSRLVQFNTDSGPESLTEARRRVCDVLAHAGLPIDAVQDMEVAVGEALSNIYEHAYNAGVGPVSVEVLTSGGAFTVVIRDEGDATVPPPIPRRLPPRTSPGGRGLYLIRRLADDVEIRLNPSGHGVTVQMTKEA